MRKDSVEGAMDEGIKCGEATEIGADKAITQQPGSTPNQPPTNCRRV